jgi:hypothetical protein
MAFSGYFSNLIPEAVKNLEKGLSIDTSFSTKERILKLKAIKKWNHIIYPTKSCCGIDNRIEGLVSWRYSDEFVIHDSKGRFVCNIGLNGIDRTYEIGENLRSIDEDILIANNIYVGYLYVNTGHKGSKKIFTALLEKEIKGQKKLKAVLYDERIYEIGYSKGAEEYAVPTSLINDFLSRQGSEYLTDVLYNEYTLSRAIKAAQHQSKLTFEDKQKIENAISYAVNWWAKVISHPEFDNGVPKRESLAALSIMERPTLTGEKIDKFKKCLGDEIRAELTLASCLFQLCTTHLHKAAFKAKLDPKLTLFPWGTRMLILYYKTILNFEYVYLKYLSFPQYLQTLINNILLLMYQNFRASIPYTHSFLFCDYHLP